MLDALPIQHQRCKGEARVTLGSRDGQTVLSELRQAGSAKAMLPRCHSARPEVVFLNTAGGLTGGDDMRFAVGLCAGAEALAATQTAERVYASSGGRASVDVRLTVGEGADLIWLPQETILFNHAGLDRRTTVNLGEGARVLMVETIVLGRHAMGERLDAVDVIDRRRIERADGAPMFHDALRLTADDLKENAAPAGLAGAGAMTVVAMAGPGATDRLDDVRRHLGAARDAAASVSGDVLIIRLMQSDAFALRRRTANLIQHLTRGPLPRVWQI